MQTVATIGVHGFTAKRSSTVCVRPTWGGCWTCASVAECAAATTRGRTPRDCKRHSADADIEYRHHKELAPTTELRQLQYREDDRRGVGKRSRTQLAREYRERYVAEILDRADLDAVIAELPNERRPARMCVEHDPEACHRSLIAERLAADYGIDMTHLRP